MKQSTYLTIVIALIIITGCGPEDAKESGNTTEGSNLAIPNTGTSQVPTLNTDSTEKQQAISTEDIQTVPTSSAVATELNPQHGQPGHRCDIEVGAPLNSKAVKPGNTTGQSQPVSTADRVSTSSNTIIPTTTVAKGINPAHGQPGHRCDIAVGAPLDSKPAPAATTTSTEVTTGQKSAVTPIPVTPILPAEKTTQFADTSSIAKNPAHGQPGHRCDIAVGALLNSKPKQ